MPATDTAADLALVPGLCGPRVYTILEAQPSLFIPIVMPADSLEFTSPWTLPALSNSFVDVGVWTVTLQASLLNYPTIAAVTQVMTATVIDPCLSTVIQPFLVNDMMVSIWDVAPQV
jgi:hypothetical protein